MHKYLVYSEIEGILGTVRADNKVDALNIARQLYGNEVKITCLD